MGTYLKLFNNHSQYETFINGGGANIPNVSYCIDINDVHYSPITFFIYHTSDCSIEKHMTKSGTAFDQTNLVKEGYFYGGTVTAYGGEGDVCAQIRNNDYSAFDNANVVTDTNSATYDGSSINTNISGTSKKFFARTNFLQTNLVPENGQIYFIKEVPRDYYLKQYSYLYTDDANNVTKVDQIFNIDDNNFKSAAVSLIADDSKVALGTSHLGTSYKVIERDGTVVSTVNSDLISGRRGYVATLTIPRSSLPSTNSVFILENTITTIDGVESHSYTKFQTNDWKLDNVVVERSDTMPILD